MKIFLGLVALILLIFVLRLGELYTQLARYRTFWNKHNQEVLRNSDGKGIRYYALGDSAAQGIGATSPQKGYPGLIAKSLGERRSERIELINLSKSGAKINDALREQIPIMKSLGVSKDTIITVEIGANDISQFDKVKFERDMNELMSKLPEQTVISDLPSFQGGRFSKNEKSVLEANEIIVRLSDKYGLKRAQLYDRVANNHGLSTLSADLFHPSNSGYANNWAPAFLEQLKNE